MNVSTATKLFPLPFFLPTVDPTASHCLGNGLQASDQVFVYLLIVSLDFTLLQSLEQFCVFVLATRLHLL